MKTYARFQLIVLFVFSLALTAAYHGSNPEDLMYEAAELFVSSLNSVQESNTVFDFEAKHRTDWHYFPESGFNREYGYVRNGITYTDMNPKQEHLANALLASGLSSRGFVKAAKVMALEDVVGAIENDTIGHRDAEKFHFTIFGDPSPTGTWGWRVEGHHLSVHYTIRGGTLVSSSPTFFGANPHEVPQGPHKGLRILSREEDLALALLQSFDSQQRQKAVFLKEAPYDIVTMADSRAKLDGSPQGLPASRMNEQQYEILLELVGEYAHNMPADIAAARMKAARETSPDRLYFGWAGRTDRPQPQPVPIGTRMTGNREKHGNYYRIQSPTFLIEYDNTQNQSNHSHSVWRDFENDFGRDVLTLHYQNDHLTAGDREFSAE